VDAESSQLAGAFQRGGVDRAGQIAGRRLVRSACRSSVVLPADGIGPRGLGRGEIQRQTLATRK
jgi:hypothetical protein